jgi:serine/threonine protein kinase
MSNLQNIYEELAHLVGRVISLLQERYRLIKQIGKNGFYETQIWQLLEDLLPVFQFISDTCGGLRLRNIIHRDIKLQNIIRRSLITKKGDFVGKSSSI